MVLTAIMIGMVTNARTLVVKIVVEAAVSLANMVVMTAEGRSASRTASRPTTPVTPERKHHGQHDDGVHEILDQGVDCHCAR
jgi:hypothetical protein